MSEAPQTHILPLVQNLEVLLYSKDSALAEDTLNQIHAIGKVAARALVNYSERKPDVFRRFCRNRSSIPVNYPASENQRDEIPKFVNKFEIGHGFPLRQSANAKGYPALWAINEIYAKIHNYKMFNFHGPFSFLDDPFPNTSFEIKRRLPMLPHLTFRAPTQIEDDDWPELKQIIRRQEKEEDFSSLKKWVSIYAYLITDSPDIEIEVKSMLLNRAKSEIDAEFRSSKKKWKAEKKKLQEKPPNDLADDAKRDHRIKELDACIESTGAPTPIQREGLKKMLRKAFKQFANPTLSK
tara:strand:- start:2188 stop:3072 length:885 start_codon:yes stop_codon:yes gene_type:complete